MPPKKETKKEPQIIARPDESGIPKADVKFTFEFSIKLTNHDQPIPNLLLMWQWYSPSSSQPSNLERYDTPLLESWISSQEVETLVFQKEFDPVRVDDIFCQTISKPTPMFVYIVNAEDGKVIEIMNIDYSSFLSATEDGAQVVFENKMPKTQEIQYFQLKATADKCLLLPLYRHYLNPMSVEVIGAKNIPNISAKPFEPCYIKYQFFDGSIISTEAKPHKNTIKWSHKHVFLMGLLDQPDLVEIFEKKPLRFEVHDQDEILDTTIHPEKQLIDVVSKIKEVEELMNPPQQVNEVGGKAGDPKGAKTVNKKEAAPANPKKDAKKDTKKKQDINIEPIVENNNANTCNRNIHGVATFLLVDFLKPSIRKLKLIAPIVPHKRYEDIESNNLQLNLTAHQTLSSGPPQNSDFFDLNSQLAISMTLAHPFGTFKKEENDNQDEKKSNKMKGNFERAIYIMPYGEYAYAKKLQDTFYEINQSAFGFTGIRQITTKKLSGEEKISSDLDYLTAIEIIDPTFRLYVIEGLSSKGMSKLVNHMHRDNPNTETMKILSNSKIRFQKRAYSDFDVDIKRIRLRDGLAQILIKPDIYIRSKEPENICHALNQINDLLKCEDIRSAASFDLFPLAIDLIQIERKYSDSLSEEDITATKQNVSKKTGLKLNLKQLGNDQKSLLMRSQTSASMHNLNTNLQNQLTTEINNVPQILNVTANVSRSNSKHEKLPALSVSQSQTILSKQQQQSETPRENTLKVRVRQTKSPDDYLTIRLDKKPKENTISLDEDVCIYGNQKNNWYEKQKLDQRERLQQDKNYFYTYSESYMSQSVDPYTLEDIRKHEITLEKERMKNKPTFSAMQSKSFSERRAHPLQIDEMKKEEIQTQPYHLQKLIEKKSLLSSRDGKYLDPNKPDFKLQILPQAVFSNIITDNKSSARSLQIETIEEKKEEVESAIISKKPMQTKMRFVPDHSHQLDKYSNLREGPAFKQGFQLPKKLIKSSNIKLQRSVQDLPSSIFFGEPFKEKVNIFARFPDSTKSMSPYDFDNYQKPDPFIRSAVFKPQKQQSYLL